jgi:septal ring factor EnvC (AmiA/AmiB activator)
MKLFGQKSRIGVCKMENREQLEQQLRDLEAQKESLFGNGADQASIIRINEQINEVRQQLSAIDREETIEERIHADEVPFAITGVDISGFPVEVIQFVEEVVKTDRKRIYNEHAIELEQLEVELKESDGSVSWYREAIEKLNDDYDSLKKKYDELEAECDEETTLRNDAETKRDAAVREKEESEESMDRLQKAFENELEILHERISEYERNAEYAERQEQPLTVSLEESTSLQEKADAIKKLFVGRENWGTVDKLYLPDGSYQVVRRAEVDAEWEAADIPEDTEPVSSDLEVEGKPTIESPFQQFQSEECSGHVVVEEPSKLDTETFEEETRRRLAEIERILDINTTSEAA